MSTLVRQPFNAAQLEILSTMSRLSKFFAERADRELEKLWDEGIINEQVIEDWGKEHMRTPYRSNFFPSISF